MKPYVYAVFLQLPCESIPPRQYSHHADKLNTAREFNAHVWPACTKYARFQKYGVARTVCAYYSDDRIRDTLSLSYAYKVKYTLALTLIKHT